VGERLVGIDPRDHEYRVPLLDGPLHERILGAQVEDVILVDPGRDHQQRPPEDRSVRRVVLDQLQEVVLKHNLAGCGGDVDAEFERIVVCHSQPDLVAAAARQVLEQVVQSLHQVPPAARHRFAQHFGIGEQEIAR